MYRIGDGLIAPFNFCVGINEEADQVAGLQLA